MSKTTVGSLPTHMLKPISKSRIRKHVHTAAFFQLVREDRRRPRAGEDLAGMIKLSAQAEVAIAERVVSFRTTVDGGESWTRWNDRKHDTYDEALLFLKSYIDARVREGYRSLVASGVLLPLNESDVRNMRRYEIVPRWALNHGSKLFDSISRWYVEQRIAHEKKLMEKAEAARAAGTTGVTTDKIVLDPVDAKAGTFRFSSVLPGAASASRGTHDVSIDSDTMRILSGFDSAVKDSARGLKSLLDESTIVEKLDRITARKSDS